MFVTDDTQRRRDWSLSHDTTVKRRLEFGINAGGWLLGISIHEPAASTMTSGIHVVGPT